MVTRRCLERRFFLRPDREMTEAFVYCLAAAARRTGVKVIFSAVMANHHHTGVVDTDGRLPEFLEYLHKFVAKCGNALRGRWESFWAPEQASCVELVTPDAVLEKMVYALTNPVKDNLVERTVHWPGLDCLTAIAEGTPIVAARPKRFFRPDTALPEHETLTFVRPPGFEHLSHDAWVEQIREAVGAVEREAARTRRELGTKVLGAKAVLRQHWDDSPRSHEPRRQLAPRVASKNKWARIEALTRNRAFIEAYRVARDAFLRGLTVVFPAGTYWLRRFAGVCCEGDGAAAS
jgi:hypothetical protein